MDQNLIKGLLLIAAAVYFGMQAPNYALGSVTSPGPGLFPAIVSVFVFLIGAAILARSLFLKSERMEYNFRNIGIISASLVGFALITEYVNMLAAIFFLVATASLASDDFSILRSIKIAAALSLIAFVMHKGLGFQLPLF